MKENKYDEAEFFEEYSKFKRSKEGLDGAGEWHEFKKLLPQFSGKRVLDLGCGYGWHAIYAAQNGAREVVGIEISEKMLAVAAEKTKFSNIRYEKMAIEDISFPQNSFDIIISSLALHYVADTNAVYKKAGKILVSGGEFIFSVEHPVFTAFGSQQWHKDNEGNILHWPVDNYFAEGSRRAIFLGQLVTKYHRNLTSYINGLIKAGFAITSLIEPTPPEHMLKGGSMDNELRRPMMLLISAKKI